MCCVSVSDTENVPTADVVQKQIDEEIKKLKEEFGSLVESACDVVVEQNNPTVFHRNMSVVPYGTCIKEYYSHPLKRGDLPLDAQKEMWDALPREAVKKMLDDPKAKKVLDLLQPEAVTKMLNDPETVNVWDILPPEAVKMWDVLLPETVKKMWKKLPPEAIKEVCIELPPEAVKELCIKLPPEVVKKLGVKFMRPEAVEFWDELPPEAVEEMWHALQMWHALRPEGFTPADAVVFWAKQSPETVKRIWDALPPEAVKKVRDILSLKKERELTPADAVVFWAKQSPETVNKIWGALPPEAVKKVPAKLSPKVGKKVVFWAKQSPETVKKLWKVLPPEAMKKMWYALPEEAVKKMCVKLPSATLKEAWDNLPPEAVKEMWHNLAVKKIWDKLPPEAVMEVCVELPPEAVKKACVNMPPEVVKKLGVEFMPLEAVDIWNKLPPKAVKKMWHALTPEALKNICVEHMPPHVNVDNMLDDPDAVKNLWEALPPEAVKDVGVQLVPPAAVKMWDEQPPQTVKKMWDALPAEALKNVCVKLPPAALKEVWDNLPQQVVKEIWQKLSVKKMLNKLSNYWNYFNYGHLELVVSQFGDGDLKQKMENYVSEVSSFKQRTRLSEYVKNPQCSDYTLKEFEVQIKHPDCTLWQVEEKFMRPIASKLTIHKQLMVIFKETAEGCIGISWLIPLEFTLKNALFETSSAFFKRKGIIAIILDGCKYYSYELEEFAKHVRMTYECQTPDFVANQWPPLPTRKVFNLAMIHSKETVLRNPFDEELIRQTVHGNVDDIVKKKTLIQLEDLFKHRHGSTNHKVILIEGAPGAGKSTLAWHVCQKWKAENLFLKFTIVIYAQLRDPEVQSAKCIAELLPTHPTLNREDFAAEIEVCFGSKVLFVLDGWDEYEPGFQQDSLIDKLIRNPEKLHLHHRTLLVTSRPIASRELQQYASSRVEIVGFTPEEIHRYFEEAVEDPQAVQNLCEQLQERPVIEASCYLPLNAAIVTHLFMEQTHKALPTTLHGLFSAVVCGCIRRCLKKHKRREEEIPSLDELPSDLEKEFKDTCTLAYEGTMKNKVSFSSQDLSLYKVSVEQNALDLMQVVQSFASRMSKLYHFLHLSVQELLTARHISLLPPPEQIQVFQDMFNNPRFAAVFQFYTAFTKLQTNGIRNIVARITQSEEKQPLLNLMHCLYEAQDVSLCCFVASQLNRKLELHDMTQSPLDCLSIGYFLSCLNQYTSEKFQVKLTGSIVGNVNFRFLAKGMSSCSQVEENKPPHPRVTLVLVDTITHRHVDGCKNLFKCLKTNMSVFQLNMYGCNLTITEDNCPLLEEMLRANTTLQELDLSRNPFNASGLGYIAKGLRHNTGLVKLSLRQCDVRVTGPLLEEMLRENTTLQELDLSRNPISASGLGYIAKGLRHNTGLVKLSLKECFVSVTEKNGPLLEEMLRENKTLHELVLSYNDIFAELSYIVKGLMHNTGLVKLSLPQCDVRVTEFNGPLLEEMLRENRTLQELDLSHNPISASGFGYIAKGLKHNTGLVKLSLKECSVSVTKENGPLLEEMLRKNKTLQELKLSHNPIGASGLGYFAKGLRHNTGLVKLSLKECFVRATGPLQEEMLRENTTLQELDLSYNDIFAELSYIAKGLTHNTGLVKLSLRHCDVRVTEDNGPLLEEENSTLQELVLSYNPISDSGLGYIAKGLRHNTGLVKLLWYSITTYT